MITMVPMRVFQRADFPLILLYSTPRSHFLLLSADPNSQKSTILHLFLYQAQ